MLSQLPYLDLVACAFGTIFIAFGLLPLFNGNVALSFFEASPIKGKSEAERTIEVLLIVYGIRDIFMGVVIYAAALTGTRQTLGWITLAGGVVAVVDGIACKVIIGKGQMNHWGYAPAVIATGLMLLEALDWVPL